VIRPHREGIAILLDEHILVAITTCMGGWHFSRHVNISIPVTDGTAKRSGYPVLCHLAFLLKNSAAMMVYFVREQDKTDHYDSAGNRANDGT